MKRPQSPLKDVADALTGRGQTDLYRWLWDRYDELPPYQKYKVNLVKLTAALNDRGIRGRDQNKPLTVGMVRKTYERVRSDRATVTPDDEAALPTPRSSSPGRRVIPPPSPIAPDPQPDVAEDDQPVFVEPRHRFIGKPAIDRARLPKSPKEPT
jgi:hypothetical protein